MSLLEKTKQINPELYELLYPKSYQYIPRNYASPKAFAESLLSFITINLAQGINFKNLTGNKKEDSSAALREFLEVAKPYKLPSFFIDKEFYKAMFNTDIKQGIDYYNLPLPFPAQVLYLPNDIEDEYKFYEENTKEPVQVIAISRFNTYNSVQYIYFQLTDKYMRFIAKDAGTINEYVNTYDVSRPFHFAINLLLAKNARPNLYNMGTKISSGKKKSIRSLWTPNFIGKGYKIKEENTQAKLFKGTHSSPRLHWRRGHFRNQRFGQELKEQKIIWIEPTLVGVNESDGTQDEQTDDNRNS